jgi:hypothetical protein
MSVHILELDCSMIVGIDILIRLVYNHRALRPIYELPNCIVFELRLRCSQSHLAWTATAGVNAKAAAMC